MPQYDYKTVRWSRFSDPPLDQIIQNETTGQWEYDDAIAVHEKERLLIFRRSGGA